MNQQLVTGQLLQPSHWQNYSNKTMPLIALATTAGWFGAPGRLPRLATFSRYASLTTAGGLALLVFAATLQQTHYYNRWKDYYAKWQVMTAPLQWLSVHTPQDSVVLTDPFGWFGEGRPFRIVGMDSADGEAPIRAKADTSLTEREVLVYSHNQVYLPQMSDALMTEEEVRHRYLAAIHFFGYPEDEARRFIRFRNGALFRGMEELIRAGEQHLGENATATIEAAYEEIRQRNPLEALGPYRADYVLVDQTSRAASRLVRLQDRLHEVYADGRFIIYRLHSIGDGSGPG